MGIEQIFFELPLASIVGLPALNDLPRRGRRRRRPPIARPGVRALINRKPDRRVVGETGDTREALRIVECHPPDIFVMDVGAPRHQRCRCDRP